MCVSLAERLIVVLFIWHKCMFWCKWVKHKVCEEYRWGSCHRVGLEQIYTTIMGSIFIPLTGVVLTSLHVMCGFVCMSNQTLSLRKEILAAQYYVKYAKLGQQTAFCPKKKKKKKKNNINAHHCFSASFFGCLSWNCEHLVKSHFPLKMIENSAYFPKCEIHSLSV